MYEVRIIDEIKFINTPVYVFYMKNYEAKITIFALSFCQLIVSKTINL